METKSITVAVLALVAGCAIGFLTANSLNRSEIEELRNDKGSVAPGARSTPPGAGKLSDEEIRAGIRKADDNPADLVYQRNMGVALYRYASSNGDSALLAESARLLERVRAAEPSNADINIALGNAFFDIGYFAKDLNAYERARTYYEVALAARPNDAALRTDLALTYFLQEKPDYERSINEFERALGVDPKNEKALEFATQAYVKKNDLASARSTIEKLRSANPSSPSIPGLITLVGGPAETSQ